MMDLVRLMLVTQTNFVGKRIHNKKHARVFRDTMLSIIEESSDYNDLESFEAEFELIKLSLSSNKPNAFISLFDDSYKYVTMATELTDNILSSVNSRFITGDSKVYLELFKVKGEIC